MKKILASEKLSLLQEIFINLQVNLSNIEKYQKQEVSFKLDLEETHAAKIKAEEIKSFLPHSEGMTATVYIHPNYPDVIFKQLSYKNAKKEHALNKQVYELISRSNLSTIKVPKSFVVQINQNDAWLVQEKCNIIDDKQAPLFYEIRDQLLALYESEETDSVIKKNIESTIKLLFLCITEAGYWDISFPNFPNICLDGKFAILDFGSDEGHEYQNHQEEALLSLAEIFCSPILLEKIGNDSLIKNARVELAKEQFDCRQYIKNLPLPKINFEKLEPFFEDEIQHNYENWINQQLKKVLKGLNKNTYTVNREIRIDIFPQNTHLFFCLIDNNLEETIHKIEEVLNMFVQNKILATYTKSAYEKQDREGDIEHVIYIYI